LVRAIGNDILGQVWEDRPGVIAVGGDDIPPSRRLGLQIVVAHQAAKLLAIHHHALVAQHRPNTAIAVALELVANLADPSEKLIGCKGAADTS
jgi:hypothetical protein